MNPLEIDGGVQRVIAALKSKGMNTSLLFFAGHSSGGIIVQDYVNRSASGLILMGSFLLRKYDNGSFVVPTLTVSGELDGLCRVTRSMESYYRWILGANATNMSITDYPVVVVPGMNHFQFASGTNVPPLVKERDLKSEISLDVAHSTVAALVTSFIETHLRNESARLYLEKSVEATGKFIQPLLDAYLLEGFYHFVHPCYDEKPSRNCTVGCGWTGVAQQIMGGDRARIFAVDAFHPVDQINPIHLPHIHNNCSLNQKDCVLNITTVSQNTYNLLDSLDTAFFETSANQIEAKLKSRQSVMEAIGYTNVDFNTTDGSSLCKLINQAAYDWALNATNPKTIARFDKFGVPMVMGEDLGPYNIGPLWIWNPLKFENTENSSGEKILLVRSVMLRTPTQYFIPLSAGFHYCKLLSPARAIEWIYVDGLRARYQ